MSVALLIPALEAKPARLIPVATESVFANERLPVADLIGTAWLQLFQTGVDFGHDELDQVISEFEQAGAQFIAQGKPYLASRAMGVIEALREAAAIPSSDLRFFIG